MSVNKVTAELAPYPMEELAKIKRELIEKGEPVFDFGTGDPNIPTWPDIAAALKESVPEISHYPRIVGGEALDAAHRGYLKRRFDLDEDIAVLPTRGSKEAVFHLALSIVGRSGGKKHIIYPDPGYPVYRTSTLFAGGTPYPVALNPTNEYLLRPWDLPKFVQRDAAAIWINYPHNPTGTCASGEYLEKIVGWAQETDTLLLSDDCYVDIYDPNMDESNIPRNPLSYGTKGVISIMSLSKRSGLTGYRAGMLAGDPDFLGKFQKARANMGLGQPDFIQAAATVAWNDDQHVASRREIFSERMKRLGSELVEWELLDEIPQATFYLWTQVPKKFKGNDIKYAKSLAENGIIVSPSQWLSEGIKGFVRFALVPDMEEIDAAIPIIKSVAFGE